MSEPGGQFGGLVDPAAQRIPTDRQSLRDLITALMAQPDILAELASALATGMGLDPRIVVALHQAADTDASAQAIHHTLGTGPRQAAAGSHEHTVPRIWRRQSNSALSTFVSATAEGKDTGIGDLLITAKNTKEYLVFYTARVSLTGADSSVDLRLRHTVAGTPTGTPATVTNTSTFLHGHSVAAQAGMPASETVLHRVTGTFLTGGVAALPVHVAAFHNLIAGGGTAEVAQASSSVRQLVVMEVSATG